MPMIATVDCCHTCYQSLLFPHLTLSKKLSVHASVRPGYYAQKGSRRVLEGAKGGNLRGN